MIFLFSDEAGKNSICLRGEEFKYLIKVRRHNVGDIIGFRNESDLQILHSYAIEEISPREVCLALQKSENSPATLQKHLHIAWCVIDPKSIEKVLPSLNEMGVERISFIYCDRSQKNFRIDQKRLRRILKSSMQQSGRSEFMEFVEYKTLPDFLKKHPKTIVLDFSDDILPAQIDFDTVLIGCEGGFSKEEKELLKTQRVYRFDTPLVLKSESAALAIAAKALL